MRQLIITADHLGANPQRSHGIFQTIEFGITTGALLLPHTPDSADAARHARERGIVAGLQCVLTEGYALSAPGDIPGLTEMDGRFFEPNKFFDQLSADALPQSSLERELRAQVEWMFDTYGPPSHIGSMHDEHLHPRVAEAVGEIMQRYGLRFVRIPEEEPLPPFGFDVPAERLAQIAAVNHRAREARSLYAAHGIETSGAFRGATLLGNASLKNLRHILSRLPEDGVTELMVHPGSPCAYGTPFDLDPQRQTELRMLLDESVPAVLAQKKVQLCSFADL